MSAPPPTPEPRKDAAGAGVPVYLTQPHTTEDEAPSVETTGVAVVTEPPPGGRTPDSTPAAPTRKKVVGASMWVLGGYGASQVIRLASNIILAKLLFPEVFGLMALVNVFMQGLVMFSDIGIGPSLVQSKRGDDPDFINTAWSLQIIRGMCLWGASFLLAWPMSVIYHEPSFLYIVPAMGATAALAGIESTSVNRLYRALMMGKLVTLELLTQIISSLVMVIWAVYFRETGAWAMVTGGLVRGVTRVALSYRLMREHKHRWCWNQDCRTELMRFGRWVFVSTLIAFLATRGDRMTLGLWLSKEELGFYSIALGLAILMDEVLDRVASRVLFPVFSRLQGQEPAVMRRKLRRARGLLLLGSLPVVCALAIFAHPIIALLYDSRYQPAAGMLRILAIGMVAGCVNNSASGIPMAMGDSFRPMVGVAWRSVALYAAMFVGGYLGGEMGLIIGVACVELICWPVNSWMLAKHKLWTPDLEIFAMGLSGAAIALGIWLVGR